MTTMGYLKNASFQLKQRKIVTGILDSCPIHFSTQEHPLWSLTFLPQIDKYFLFSKVNTSFCIVITTLSGFSENLQSADNLLSDFHSGTFTPNFYCPYKISKMLSSFPFTAKGYSVLCLSYSPLDKNYSLASALITHTSETSLKENTHELLPNAHSENWKLLTIINSSLLNPAPPCFWQYPQSYTSLIYLRVTFLF